MHKMNYSFEAVAIAFVFNIRVSAVKSPYQYLIFNRIKYHTIFLTVL